MRVLRRAYYMERDQVGQIPAGARIAGNRRIPWRLDRVEHRAPSPAEPSDRPGRPTPGTDPRLDLVAGAVDLAEGQLAFVHPRDAMALLDEEDVAADQAYPPYWAELWPSGIELARAVSAVSPETWRDTPVLELGCGLGLPAVAAALAGARVLATDRSVDATTFAAVNAEQNGVRVETAVCAWDTPGPVLARAPWRLVLAADVLYGQRNVVQLLDLLPRLVDDGGEVWIADPRRPLTEEFLAAARTAWRSVETTSTRLPQILIHRLAGPRGRPAAVLATAASRPAGPAPSARRRSPRAAPRVDGPPAAAAPP
jgi:predicted nicotinamide N-methyase